MNKTKVYQLVREAWPYCPHCGDTDTLQTHHRRNRGVGGSKILDRFDNLIRVCAALNYAMESDANVAMQAKDMGWKLGQWQDFSQPVFDTQTITWWQLDKDGSKVQVDPPSYLI